MPEPIHRREGQDFFGNRLTWIEIEEPHRTLTVKLAARVSVDAAAELDAPATPAWEAVREEAFATSDIGPHSPAHFLFPSRMVSLDPEIRDYTRESFPAGRPVLDAAIELMNRLKDRHHLRYRRNHRHHHAADVVRSAPRRLSGLRPHHDFRTTRHWLAGGLRERLPADDAANRPDAIAGRGRHACVGAGLVRRPHPSLPREREGTWGWIGLDPTNAVIASDQHVVLAVGRDYTDVAPMDGVIVGSGGQQIDVAVNVTPAG